MEAPTDEMRAVAKAINAFLNAREPDYSLTSALLTATQAADLLPDHGDPPLIVWTDRTGRYVLALVGGRLVHAGVSNGADPGWATAYGRADVRSVHAQDLTPPEDWGADIGWYAHRWTITLAGGTEITVSGTQATKTLDRISTFMRALMP